jgi:hypothetical protein
LALVELDLADFFPRSTDLIHFAGDFPMVDETARTPCNPDPEITGKTSCERETKLEENVERGKARELSRESSTLAQGTDWEKVMRMQRQKITQARLPEQTTSTRNHQRPRTTKKT